MADKSVVRVSNITFCFEIPNISQLKTVFSPEFSVQGTLWYVVVEKLYCKQEWHVGYRLCRRNIKQSNDDVHAASILVKLLAWDNKISVQHNVSGLLNNCTYPFYNDTLIQWNKLFANEIGFVLHDTVKVEIYLKVVNPNEEKSAKDSTMRCLQVDRCCEMGCMTTRRFEIDNIRHLSAVRSRQFAFNELDWNLIVLKNNLDQLDIWLNSNEKIECKAKMSLKIFSSKIVSRRIESSDTVKEFRNLNITNAISMEELLKPENGFTHNDCVIVDVQIKAGCCLFAVDSLDKPKKLKLECAICLMTITDQNVSSTSCGHLFCTTCITMVIQMGKSCPLCNSPATLKGLRGIYLPTKD